MAKRLLPVPGVIDEIGDETHPIAKLVALIVQLPDGTKFLLEGFDASKIGSGFLDPGRINNLASTTKVDNGITLADIIADATQGATDPAEVINAGSTLLNGDKIQDNTLSLAAIKAAVALAQVLKIANGGAWQTDDYAASSISGGGVPVAGTGIKIGKGAFDVALGTIRALLTGSINIAGKFLVDANGNTIWNDPANGPGGFRVNANGDAYLGADTYDAAPFQLSHTGDFFLNYRPGSNSRIDPALIATTDGAIGVVQASPAGGQYSGLVSLTPLTGGATVYYTTNGSDPSDESNGVRQVYVSPVNIDTSGGNVTLKAVAYKVGHYGTVGVWTFTQSASAVAQPTFDPIPGFYTTQSNTFPVSLACGTPGATINYTIDGSDPGPANGAVYVTPILIPKNSVDFPIRAMAMKAGLTNSAIVEGDYTITKGQGGQGTGGNTP